MIQSLWSDYDTVDWEKIQEQDFPNDNIPNYYGKEKSDKKTGKTYSYSSMGFFCGNSLGDEPEPSIDNCVKNIILNGERSHQSRTNMLYKTVNFRY